MDRSLTEAERLSPARIGQRQEFFLSHARGLCLLYRGRYREAQPCLEAAAALGESMGDLHVAAFDRVYLGEALLFQAQYDEAARALEKLAAGATAARARRMALARLALLRALAGAGAGAVRATVADYDALPDGRPVPLLDAWDSLFVAWAHSVSGHPEALSGRLDPAERFFRDHGLRPALDLAHWVRAEGWLLAGDEAAAARALAAARAAPESDLARVLYPLLEARLLLGGAPRSRSRSAAADLLARAGAELVGNPLPEWSARLSRLRARLRPRSARTRSDEGERQRDALARRVPEEWRASYLESDHWKAWTLAERAHEPRGVDAENAGGESFAEEVTRTIAPPRASDARARLVTRSAPMRQLASLLDRLKSVDLPVLIAGETGSGKDLIARVIHAESSRSAGPFSVVDSAAVPPELFEAELFGARAGAFTGLDGDRAGILKGAAGGTLLLSEVGDVPLEVQAKLLRVIDTSRFRPLGAETEETADVRFLFATARDLAEDVERGRCRRDFYHRIAVFTLTVPPLRQRPEDLPELVSILLDEGLLDEGMRGAAREDGAALAPPVLESDVLERLRRRPWPGNVRELENLLLRLALENPDRIGVEALKRSPADPDTTSLFPRNLLEREALSSLKERLERDYIVHHLRRLDGRTGELCDFLKLSRRQLYRRCERLGISLRRERKRLRPPRPGPA